MANNWPRPVQARKPAARGNGHRLHATSYSENKQLPSWKSDQPTGVLRAPAKPMVQPQLAAPSAEPALKLVHGDNDWMQGRGPQGLITLGWIMPVKGKLKPSGHWTEKVLRITPGAVPLGWVQSGLGRKSRLCDGEGNLGQRRRTRVLPPKGSERSFKRSLWQDVEHPRETNKIANAVAESPSDPPSSGDDVEPS